MVELFATGKEIDSSISRTLTPSSELEEGSATRDVALESESKEAVLPSCSEEDDLLRSSFNLFLSFGPSEVNFL